MAPTLGRPADDFHAAQPLDALAQAQEDEREVLKAIFMDDYQEVEAKGSWGVRIRCSPCAMSFSCSLCFGADVGSENHR